MAFGLRHLAFSHPPPLMSKHCLTLSESLYKKAKGRGKALGAVLVVQTFPEPFLYMNLTPAKIMQNQKVKWGCFISGGYLLIGIIISGICEVNEIKSGESISQFISPILWGIVWGIQRALFFQFVQMHIFRMFTA